LSKSTIQLKGSLPFVTKTLTIGGSKTKCILGKAPKTCFYKNNNGIQFEIYRIFAKSQHLADLAYLVKSIYLQNNRDIQQTKTQYTVLVRSWEPRH
jgi:hypothetical protein